MKPMADMISWSCSAHSELLPGLGLLEHTMKSDMDLVSSLTVSLKSCLAENWGFLGFHLLTNPLIGFTSSSSMCGC